MLLLLALAPTRAQLAGATIVVGGGGLAAGVLAVAAGGLRTAGGAGGASGVVALAGLIAAMAACAFAARALVRRRDAPVGWLRTTALVAAAVVLVGTIATVVGHRARPRPREPERRPAAPGFGPEQPLRVLEGGRSEAFADHPWRRGHAAASASRGCASARSARRSATPTRCTSRRRPSSGWSACSRWRSSSAASRSRPRRVARPAGAAAALAVYALHAGIDWDWEMPALTLLALVLAGALIAGASATPVHARARDDPTP